MDGLKSRLNKRRDFVNDKISLRKLSRNLHKEVKRKKKMGGNLGLSKQEKVWRENTIPNDDG